MFGPSFGSCFAFYKSRRMRRRRRSRRQCKPICIKRYLLEGRGSGYCIPCIQIPYVKKFSYVIKFIVPDLNFMVKCCLEFFVKLLSLIISNIVIIYGNWVHCNVYISVRYVSPDVDLISWISDQGYNYLVKSQIIQSLAILL